MVILVAFLGLIFGYLLAVVTQIGATPILLGGILFVLIYSVLKKS
jgi:hypothetical protein